MECDRILDLLSEYLGGELPPEAAGEVDVHLSECPGCAAAAQGLRETLAMLAALPDASAPPELIEGVLRRIEREKAEARSPGRKVLNFVRASIPVEAAAAVFLFLLLYGVQREMPVDGTVPPAAVRVESPRTESAGAARGEDARSSRAGFAALQAAGKETAADRRRAPLAETARPPALPDPSPGAAAVHGEPRDAMHGDVRAPRAQDARERPGAHGGAGSTAGRPSPLPSVPATLASSQGRTLPSAPHRDEAVRHPVPGMLAAPPSRLLRPLPYGREVTIVVSHGERTGIEERIAAAALRRGGAVVGGTGSAGERAEPAEGEMRTQVGTTADERERQAAAARPDAVRVHLPAASADAFIDDLRRLGTLPAEGMPSRIDLPAGPYPGVVAYTVRIRVR